MTRDELLAELLVERFAHPTRAHQAVASRPDSEHAHTIRQHDLHNATRRRAKPTRKGA